MVVGFVLVLSSSVGHSLAHLLEPNSRKWSRRCVYIFASCYLLASGLSGSVWKRASMVTRQVLDRIPLRPITSIFPPMNVIFKKSLVITILTSALKTDIWIWPIDLRKLCVSDPSRLEAHTSFRAWSWQINDKVDWKASRIWFRTHLGYQLLLSGTTIFDCGPTSSKKGRTLLWNVGLVTHYFPFPIKCHLCLFFKKP